MMPPLETGWWEQCVSRCGWDGGCSGLDGKQWKTCCDPRQGWAGGGRGGPAAGPGIQRSLHGRPPRRGPSVFAPCGPPRKQRWRLSGRRRRRRRGRQRKPGLECSGVLPPLFPPPSLALTSASEVRQLSVFLFFIGRPSTLSARRPLVAIFKATLRRPCSLHRHAEVRQRRFTRFHV